MLERVEHDLLNETGNRIHGGYEIKEFRYDDESRKVIREETGVLSKPIGSLRSIAIMSLAFS
jgi:hypothetical protein